MKILLGKLQAAHLRTQWGKRPPPCQTASANSVANGNSPTHPSSPTHKNYEMNMGAIPVSVQVTEIDPLLNRSIRLYGPNGREVKRMQTSWINEGKLWKRQEMHIFSFTKDDLSVVGFPTAFLTEINVQITQTGQLLGTGNEFVTINSTRDHMCQPIDPSPFESIFYHDISFTLDYTAVPWRGSFIRSHKIIITPDPAPPDDLSAISITMTGHSSLLLHLAGQKF